MLALLSRHFTTDQDSMQVGFWMGNSDFGNIVGFFLCTCFIYYFQTGWQVCLAAVSLFSLGIFILFKVLLEDNRTEVVNEDCCSSVEEILAFFRNVKWTLLFLSVISIGATQYGILLWLPTYLEEKGFEDFSGFISICYSAFTVLGVTICSKVYGLTSSRAYHFLAHLVILAVGIVAMMLVYTLDLKSEDKWLMLLLIGVVGFCIGGLYDLIAD